MGSVNNADFTVPSYEVARIRVFIEDEVNDPVSVAAILTGDQEVPEPTGSTAIGSSSLTLNAAGDALEYDLTVSGLDFWQLLGTEPTTPDTGDDVTRIHIHDNVRGENGPVAFGIFDLVAPEVGDQDIDDLSVVENADGSVTLSGIWEETDPALIPLSNFVDEIRDAEPGEDIGLYWNIHTEQFPGGEIRGQLIGDPADVPEVIVGTAADETLPGGNGNDTVAGGLGNDLITGNNGNDVLRGDLNSRSSGGSNGGNDQLFGGAGDDRIGGKGGNDQLFGEAGNDSLWGDAGDDQLDGGFGDDQLFGGDGADQFVLAVGNGTDVIGDFEVGVDRFAIAQLSFEQLELTQEGSAVQISLVETEEVLAVVSGVEVSDLTADSFV